MAGILRIQGAGIDLQYIAVGDVVISGMCPSRATPFAFLAPKRTLMTWAVLLITGDVINQDRMIFRATGHVNISSSMTCRFC
jgi:hypothetical protein